MFACLLVCMLAAYLLRNGWTDLAKLFLLAPSWSRDGFRPINLDPGSGFSENPEKTILVGNSKIFLQKSSNIHVKNR